MPQLDEELESALRKGDKRQLALTYEKAARSATALGDTERAAFLLTHAWVLALDAGDEMAETYAKELRSLGRL